MRLLIVEDNVELAWLVANGLMAAGYEADIVCSVDEARDALRSVSYAAMILDLSLPDGDGLSILLELRRRSDPLPVLVLTARNGLQDESTVCAAERTTTWLNRSLWKNWWPGSKQSCVAPVNCWAAP